MSEISEGTRKKLKSSKYVAKVKAKHIEFTPEFKILSVEEFLNGKSPDEIFKQSGLYPEWFPKDYCRECIKRWKKKFSNEGKDSLKVNNTGRNSTGRPRNPSIDDLTKDELRAIVEIQRETIEMLKKTRALPNQKKDK